MSHANLIEAEDALAEIVRGARTVAVLGMRDEANADTPAYQIPAVLKERGLKVVPINPKIASALGEPSLAGVGALRESVDILDVFRRPEFIAGHADEVLALPPGARPKVVWLQTGIRDDRAAARLAEAGIRVVQDKCLGVYAAKYRPKP